MAVYDLADCSLHDKAQARQALYNLEHDLSLLATGQSWVTDINQMIHKTGLGMVHNNAVLPCCTDFTAQVHNRRGGIPMKLRFFLPPYELLDMQQKTILPMNQVRLLARFSLY